MLEVVFSESAAGALVLAMGVKSGIIDIIPSGGEEISQAKAEQIRQEAEQRERSRRENAVPLEGGRENILSFPLALSVGGIAEVGIGSERERVLASLYGVPERAVEVAAGHLAAARKSMKKLLKQAKAGEPIRVWAGRTADEVCGSHWLAEQLRPIGLEKLNVTLVELPNLWEDESSGEVTRYNSWGEVEPCLFGRMAALGKKLSSRCLDALAERWRQLRQENASLHAVLNGNLVGVPETFYDPFTIEF